MPENSTANPTRSGSDTCQAVCVGLECVGVQGLIRETQISHASSTSEAMLGNESRRSRGATQPGVSPNLLKSKLNFMVQQ